MTFVRLQIRSLSLEIGADWTIAPPWDDPRLHATHGVYLTHRASALELHVRASNVVGDEARLRAWLRSQQWGEPPFDELGRRVGAVVTVAGTFRMRGMEPRWDRVREWYVSDGRHGADAALPHASSTDPRVIAACERLIETVVFAAS